VSTITAILGALAGLIGSWKTPTNVENDIADGVLLLTQAQNVDPSLAVGGVVLKYVQQVATSYANLTNDQAALVATVPAAFAGESDAIVVIALRQSSALAKQLLGL
jgi:hypothetical protein